MIGGKTIDIDKTRWFEEEDQSPKFSMKDFGLGIKVLQARRDGEKTAALLGTYRLPGRFGYRYGGKITQAIHIVMVDIKAGSLFFSNVASPHSAPVVVKEPPDVTKLPDDEAEIVAVEGHFNVDLSAQLGLGPKEAEYVTFAWIDEITSPIELVELAENDKRPEPPPEPVGSVGADVLRFTRHDGFPKPPKGGIALTSNAGKVPLAALKVFCAADPALLPKSEPQAEDPPTYVFLAAVGQTDQRFVWAAAPVPYEGLKKKECAFEVVLGHLVDQSEEIQRAHVIAIVGGEKSDVLVVEPKKP